jgi:hypothetical protein
MNEPIEYFIEKGFITNWNKEQVIGLLAKIQSSEVQIKPFDAFDYDGDALEFLDPSNFADWLYAFTDADCENLEIGSFSKVAQILERINAENNVGPPYDFDLLEAIDEKDYEKDIYKLTSLNMIWYHLQHMDNERRN